jgi:transposase
MDEVLPPSELAESAYTTRNKGARIERVEVITRGERRRSWTPEQKREIVVESFGPDLRPTEVARKYAISTGQLYTWRQQLMNEPTAVVTRAAPRFAQVDLSLMSPPPGGVESGPAEVAEATPPPPPLRPDGLIEIELPGGVVVRVDGQVDGRALRRVLGALEGR